jgi:hypothetical protein
MLEIPRRKVCVNLLDDDFMPTIYFSLLQDEYQPRQGCISIQLINSSLDSSSTPNCARESALFLGHHSGADIRSI